MQIDKNCLACSTIARCMEICDCVRATRFAPDEVAYHMGDPQDGVWQVLQGYVALRVFSASGQVALLRVVRRGGVFGYRSFLTDVPRSCSAVAMTPAMLKHVPASLLRRMIEREPGLGLSLQHTMADAFRETHDRMVLLSNHNARCRFLELCAWLAAAEGLATPPSGFSIRLPITFQDMAQMLAITPETLSRATRRLQNEGVIGLLGRLVTLAPGWTAYLEAEPAKDPGRPQTANQGR